MWIELSVFRSFLVALKILYIRYDKTAHLMFPIIINIIVGCISLSYFTLYYNEHFAAEFSKPEYYVFAAFSLFANVLGYYIIRTCPNPAYFRVFVTLQIILLFLFTIYINMNMNMNKNKEHNISIQSTIGLVCGCAAIILISLDKNNK
jgi:hypothetical protein